jgi:hypothetical protein
MTAVEVPMHHERRLAQFVIPGSTKPAPYLIPGNRVFFWIPAFAEILKRYIILHLEPISQMQQATELHILRIRLHLCKIKYGGFH